MLRDEIEIALVENISTFIHGGESKKAADAVIAVFKERLGREDVLEAIRDAWSDFRPDTSMTLKHARHICTAIYLELEK